jgi:sarcosine oxidase, subunit gamma
MLEHSWKIDGSHFRAHPVIERGLLLIQGRTEDPVLSGVLHRQLGIEPPAPLTVNVRDSAAILSLGPREWLLELPASAASFACTSLTIGFARAGDRGAASALYAVTDMSDAFAGFDLSGPRAVDVLMSGCSIDPMPHALPVGSVVRTVLADVPVILWNASCFRCWVDRSFAAHLWSWIAESPARW